MKDISVVILNYNSSSFTINCVKSIIDHSSTNLSFDIVVVDNNSVTEEFEKLSEIEKLNIKIIRNDKNYGFGSANNIGAENGESKYVFFLNNDCEFINDNLMLLYEFMELNHDAALCAGQMYDEKMHLMKSVNYIPSLSLKILGNSTMRFLKKRNYPPLLKEYRTPLYVQSLAGASLFFRRSVFDTIGGFDPNIFLYCEEEDISMRLVKEGHEIYLVPEAKYIHYLSKSTKVNYYSKREFFISLMYFYRKHYGGIKYKLLKYLHFVKLIRKFGKNDVYKKLAFFVLDDADMKKSLKFKQ